MEEKVIFTVSDGRAEVFIDAGKALEAYDKQEGHPVLQKWTEGANSIYCSERVDSQDGRDHFYKNVVIPRRIEQLKKIKKQAEDELALLRSKTFT